MSEHDQTRKFADKSAAIASETLEKGKAAAEQATRAVQQSYSATVENIRDFNVKMIDMAQANAEARKGTAKRQPQPQLTRKPRQGRD